MNPFLRYLADKNSAHTQTDRQTDAHTDRHTPMITIPCGLRRAGKNVNVTEIYEQNDEGQSDECENKKSVP